MAVALFLAAIPGAASGETTAQDVQGTLSAPGANVSSAVLQLSEADPGVALTALQTALTILGAGSNASGQLVAAFADDIGNVADCDPDAGHVLSNALAAVFRNPAFAALMTNSPSAVALAEATMVGLSVTPVAPAGSGGSSNPPGAATGSGGSSNASGDAPAGARASVPSTATFGSFGSAAGTAAGTSPAS